MPYFEYKVVPAPKKGLKGKGIKTVEARFANAMMNLMNEMGAEGWEYQRADTLPCEERSGLRGRNTTFQNMLVFRRELHPETTVDEADAPQPETAPAAPLAAAKSHAPLLNGPTETNTAPALGPATDEAVEVRDPRTNLTPQ